MKKHDLKAICDQMFSDYPDIVTVRQVQKMLGCSRIFVYNRIDEGKLPAIRIGCAFKIPKMCVTQFLLENEKIVEPDSSSKKVSQANFTFGEKKARK